MRDALSLPKLPPALLDMSYVPGLNVQISVQRLLQQPRLRTVHSAGELIQLLGFLLGNTKGERNRVGQRNLPSALHTLHTRNRRKDARARVPARFHDLTKPLNVWLLSAINYRACDRGSDATATSFEHRRVVRCCRPAPPRAYRGLLPLVFCPFAGIVYYVILSSAFLQSMRFVVEAPSGLSGWIPTSEMAWDTHWFYRLIAEAGSIGGATFIAAGLARERGRAGGVLGGLGIAAVVGFVAYVTYVLQVPESLDEPWYQDYVTMVVPLVSPVIGFFVGELAKEVSTSKSSGPSWSPAASLHLAMVADLVLLFVVNQSRVKVFVFEHCIIFELYDISNCSVCLYIPSYSWIRSFGWIRQARVEICAPSTRRLGSSDWRHCRFFYLFWHRNVISRTLSSQAIYSHSIVPGGLEVTS
jgi:hypothetical protein